MERVIGGISWSEETRSFDEKWVKGHFLSGGGGPKPMLIKTLLTARKRGPSRGAEEFAGKRTVVLSAFDPEAG
jgi:hypothetical protein